MSGDVIWIVTDEAVEAEVVPGERDGQAKRNPYDSQPVKSVRRGVAVSAEKLEQGMVDFVGVVGRVLEQTKQKTGELTGLELDEIEVQVEVNGEGQLSLLGSGGKLGMKGAMTLKFKTKKP
jgi:hypothetical protein